MTTFSTAEKLALLDVLVAEPEAASELVGSLRLRVFAVAQEWDGLEDEWEAFSRKNDIVANQLGVDCRGFFK
jgi:hypothetical protein